MRRAASMPATVAGLLVVGLVAGSLGPSPVLAAGPSVVVRPGDTLSAIAVRNGTTVAVLVALNGLSDADRIYPGQRITLPPPRSAGSATGSQTATIIHVVRWGEHLTAIAARYGTTVAAIVRLNDLADPNRILAGQRLLVPDPGAATRQPAPAASPTVTTHRIQPGETLTAIAARYGTTIAAIVRLNGLADAGFIRAGDLLRIPAASTTTSPPAGAGAGLQTNTRRLMDERAAVRDLITKEARRAGVPVTFALAVAWQESGWQQPVVSSAGAVGIMQLLPSTADWVASNMLDHDVDVDNARQNVRAGMALLRHYFRRYHGNRSLVLAAYYQGQRSVDEHGILPISRPYIASILALEAMLRG
jgi:LysM repeat protein